MKRLIGFLIVITLTVGIAGSAHAATCVTARRGLTGEVPKTLTIEFNEAESPSCQLTSVVIYMGTGNWLQRTSGLICIPSMDNWVDEGTDEVTIYFDPPLEVGDSRTTCIADNLGFYWNSGQSMDATIECLGVYSTYSGPFDNFYDVVTYKTAKISEANIGTCGELPPPGEHCFDFNDGTDQGWTLEGALDEDGDGPFANNFSFWWSDATNYPNPPCNDPMSDNNGSISFFTASGHGINNPGASWFIMQMYSPDLSGMPEWQSANGYTCAISENMAFMGTLYANLFVRVYDIDAGADVWLYSGDAQPLSHDVCGDSEADWNYMEFDWSGAASLPANYIVRQIHINFFGNMQGTGYEGGVYIDEVCAIPGDVEPPEEDCYPDLPDPELVVDCKYLGTGSDGNSYWYYEMDVTNYAAFPDEIFVPAPDLPPCGLNTNSSRTWVEIFAEGGQRLYGFCGLNSAAALNIIWFAVREGVAPPPNVYIEIWDRRCDIIYTSNLASTDVPVCGDECEQPMLTLEGYREVDWDDPDWEVQVEVLNHGPGTAYNVTATMNSDIPWLIIPDATCNYGNIPEGASSWGLDSYTFDLTNSPGGSFNVWFDVSYYDECGNQYRLRLDPEFDRDTETAPLLSYELVQNYPNPFNPSTSISFQIPEPGHVSLRIYDVTGRLIRTVINNHRTAGNHTVHWDGKDSQGIAVSSGIYFYKIQAGRFIDTKRMVLLR